MMTQAINGLFAPARTPRDIVVRVHAETVKALADGVVGQRLAAQGFDPVGTTPEQLAEIVRRDLARLKKVIASANIRAE